ncbi:MAG: hypothetical protein NVS1B11_05570 [Terriglobales bacterium]
MFPQEYPEFGLYGRGGKLYDWYGMGQSLLMLPFDIVGTGLEKLPIFSDYSGNDPAVRSIFVSYCVNTLLTVLTVLVSFRFLRLLAFTTKETVAGVLALLFATTHLHYAQNMMENDYIMLLTLTGFTFQHQWLRTGNGRALLIGSMAFGLNLLTRLTTGLDLLAGGFFLLLVFWSEGVRGKGLWERFLIYVKTALPVYSIFLLIDRIYQYHRFGSFFTTYVKTFAEKYKQLDPTLPANYPWETPFHVGFLGPLITPEKSIFLFDPLVLLTILVMIAGWRYIRPDIRAYLVTALLLLIAYISLYARYTVWSGDFAWGDRYVSTAAELFAFISVPLLLRYRMQLGKLVWISGLTLIVVSTAIQIASLAFWLPLEIYQMETLGHPTWVIVLRFKNIAAFALGKMDQWGLNNHAMTEDPWDYVHITCWNFLPFLLRRAGQAPSWVVNFISALWSATVIAFVCALLRLHAVLRRFTSDTKSALA